MAEMSNASFWRIVGDANQPVHQGFLDM